MKAAEADEGRGAQRLLDEDAEFEGVDPAKCAKASQELHSMLVRYTGAEAATIFPNVTGLDGVEAVQATRQLQHKNAGTDVRSAVGAFAPEGCEGHTCTT